MIDALLDFDNIEYTEYLDDLDWDSDNYTPYDPNADHGIDVQASRPIVEKASPSLAVVMYQVYSALNRLDKDLAINPWTLMK